MQNHRSLSTTTIAAPASGSGGAIALIRLSGPEALSIAESIFSKPLATAKGYTAHFGTVAEGERLLDEVIVTVFRAPHSYTGEEMIEISCHGSAYIVQEILALLIRRGATPATAGEFTRRAFLNGKLDLSQAEAVADLIASESGAAHRIALNQMRGGYAVELTGLREKLLHITSLLELELDFSEEDVEFADRHELQQLLANIQGRCRALADSFRMGNGLKNGIPVAIVGAPNAGKSTLLNRLIGEERAIVSEVAGTTRDFIEESIVLDGIRFRFIDTAGLRHTEDRIEALGIARAKERMAQAQVVLLLIAEPLSEAEAQRQIAALALSPEQQLVVLLNKCDVWDTSGLVGHLTPSVQTLSLSARTGAGVEALKQWLSETFAHGVETETLIVTNVRHYDAFIQADEALERASTALTQSLPADLVSEEIRQVIHHLGEITGEITTDDILGNIFSKFCIGK